MIFWRRSGRDAGAPLLCFRPDTRYDKARCIHGMIKAFTVT
jgi:hypothetical protein